MLFISKSLSRGLRSKTFTYIKARNQLTTNVFHNLNRYVSLFYNKIQIRKPFWRPKKWLSCASWMPFSSSLTVKAITRTESTLWMVPSYKQISELSDSESFQRLHNNANCALHNHYNAKLQYAHRAVHNTAQHFWLAVCGAANDWIFHSCHILAEILHTTLSFFFQLTRLCNTASFSLNK